MPADSLLTIPDTILLYKHISALGIFSKTALIHPMYGTGELPQVFGPYISLKIDLLPH
jgi:RAB protein geranylgeranyltransferase component A